MQNVPSSKDENGRALLERNSDAGSQIPQCFSMLEDEQEQSKCGKRCDTFLYGTFVAFVYVLSVIFLLATFPIVAVYIIIMYSVISTARNLYLMAAYNKWFDMCYYNTALEKKMKKGRDRLYAWFNYFDKQCECLGCKKCLNVLYYVLFYFVMPIGIVCSVVQIGISFLCAAGAGEGEIDLRCDACDECFAEERDGQILVLLLFSRLFTEVQNPLWL